MAAALDLDYNSYARCALDDVLKPADAWNKESLFAMQNVVTIDSALSHVLLHCLYCVCCCVPIPKLPAAYNSPHKCRCFSDFESALLKHKRNTTVTLFETSDPVHER